MHQITIYDEENEVDTSLDDNAPEDVQRAWKRAKQVKKAAFTELSWSAYDDWGNSTYLHDRLVDIIREWAERSGKE